MEKGYEIAGVGKFGGGQGKGSVATEPHSNQKAEGNNSCSAPTPRSAPGVGGEGLGLEYQV